MFATTPKERLVLAVLLTAAAVAFAVFKFFA